MDDPIGRWLIEAALLLIAAILAAAQEALTNANDGKLEENEKAAGLLRMLENPKPAVTALRGVRTFLLVFAAVLLQGFFYQKGTSYTLTALCCCLAFAFAAMVLCKLVPERLGRRHPEDTALRLYPLIRGLTAVMTPFVLLGNLLSGGVLRLFGVDPKAPEEEVTQEEIQDMLDFGEESGVIESDEHEMIKNVFDFGDRTAADCMTHRTDVTALWAEDDRETILNTIRESGLSRFPVYGEDIDDVLGVLATRDYLLNDGENDPKPLKALLRLPYFVPETVPCDVLLRDMQKNKNHLAVVVDEYGGVSGIITMEDLLEEIVGNIYDEFDPTDESEIQPLGENQWKVSGTAELETLAEEMNVTLPRNEDFDTLGGLVFSRFSTIPEDGTKPEFTLYCTEDGEKPEDEGEAAETARFRIQVELIEDRRVEWARVTLLPPESAKE